MRLLHTTTLKLHEFFGSEIPYYAILSHRWGDQEVTFQELQQGRGPSMAWWAKIVGCCAQARKEGWEYAVSLLIPCLLTVRILEHGASFDDTSGLILAVSINRAAQSYRKLLTRCFNGTVAHKYAMRTSQTFLLKMRIMRERCPFRKSQWFKRGWTLQELLAPQTLVFFDHAWSEIGTKSSFGKLIASITRIDEQFDTMVLA